MLRRLPQLGLSLALVTFIGCSGNKKTPSYNPSVGPFDEDGNYIEAWADNPPKRSKRQPSQPAPRIADLPEPKPTPPKVQPRRPGPPIASTSTPKPKPVVKPKPKPAPVKVKPKTIRHTVGKGDTLYGLARKYGTTVSAIQKANRLSGTTIQTGKSLIIPK